MITTVTGKNQITVPAAIALKSGIKVGTRLEWNLTEQLGVLRVVILPDRVSVAESLLGAGAAHLTPGSDPLISFVNQRQTEDDERLGWL